MKGQSLLTTRLAGVAYAGNSGTTSHCIAALTRLIYGGEPLKKGALLSCDQSHAFVLFAEYGEVFIIKNGFTSGYSGEGPHGLAVALEILQRHNIDVDEYEVDKKLLHRLEHSCLLQTDLDRLESTKPIRPQKLYDYVFPFKEELRKPSLYLAQYYPSTVPFRLIDERIMDLAVAFSEDHDRAIFSAYRRLEDTVRQRTGINGSGSKLFSRSFLSDEAPLTWDVRDPNEAKGRASMFTSVFGAFRNSRMHCENKQTEEEALREFLLVNELFLLEASAIRKRCPDEAGRNQG